MAKHSKKAKPKINKFKGIADGSHERDIRRRLAEIKEETIEEFLARGGKVKPCKNKAKKIVNGKLHTKG